MVGMVAKETSPVPLQRNRRGFMNLLSSAACEWFLIFLLFVDAALSYLLTKFACYCELQTPCLLCSRLDHFFGNKKPKVYLSLFCSNHRIEISSLISCHIHSKLTDARGMCEECLMSFAMQNNSESYRLLVGKLGVDLEQCGFQSPFSNKNYIPHSLSTRICSCCNRSWRTRSNVQRLLQITPIGFGATKPNVRPPLPRLPSRSRFSHRDSLKRIRDKFSGPVTSHRLGNNGIDTLSHIGYSELKITSDSEVPFSDDDDDGSSLAREKVDPKEDLVVQCGSEILPGTQIDDLAPVKQAQQVSNPAPSLLDQCVQLDVSEPRDVKCLASDVVIGHGLGELNWQQVNPKPNHSALPHLISLYDVPPSSNVVEVPSVASANKPNVPLSKKSSLFALSELVSLDGISLSSDVVEKPLGVTPEKSVDVIGNSDTGHTSFSMHAEFSKLTSTEIGAGHKTDQIFNDTVTSMPNDMDPSDACKFTVSCKGREVHGMHAEQPDPGKVPEDSKLLPQILSSAHGIDISLNNTSCRMYGHHDELERSDASSTNGIRVLQNLASLERNDSGYESEGSSLSELESESVVDRLKREVEYDRRCMSALYKELDEERNASAVSANQAMAMITRLQEEKAALHMEALQYLRMMEEQAEYDMEALQKANDLLAEKEKEIQDLEVELEFYRNNFPDESMVLHEETYNSKGGNVIIENNGEPCIANNAYVPCYSMSAKISEGSDESTDVNTSLLEFEDEKLYISHCLNEEKASSSFQ